MTPHPLAGHRLERLDREPTAGAYCCDCGAGWRELPDEAIREIRGCGFEGYYGPEEDCTYTVCPSCYARDSICNEPRWLYRPVNRRSIHLTSHSQAA